MTVRVLVCGSRTWDDIDTIRYELADLVDRYGRERLVIAHGGARGADRLAAAQAVQLGVRVLPPFRPDWLRHGRAAGFVRNLTMLDWRPDLVLAFTCGTGGTQHTIDNARRRRIPTKVIHAQATLF